MPLTCRERWKISGWHTRTRSPCLDPVRRHGAKLGEGFQHWLDVNFAGLIRFFEQALELGGLTPEQETIARALLAGAYQSAGRSEDAESTYRGILDLDPLFEIDALVERVNELYGVTVFDGQLEVFRNVRRIR